jgi:c-di-GMP-binding flagellar brake protein YcgR
MYMFLFGRERKAAKAPVKTATAAAGAQKRGAFRAAIHIPVSYLISTDRRPHRRIGIMRDISAGGTRVISDRAFDAGTPIEMRFTLPNKFLDTFARDVKETVVSPFGERQVKSRKTIRTFDEMLINGTIVRAVPYEGKFALAIRFIDVDNKTEEEIARFNHYYQLYQVRKLKESQE